MAILQNNPIHLDNTKRATFRQCKKKYFLQHVKGLQSNYGSTAIRYGVCWHGIMEGFYSWVKENGWPKSDADKFKAIGQALQLGEKKFSSESAKKSYVDDFKNFNAAAEAFSMYLDFFSSDKEYMEIINTEKVFECPIEPENEAEEKLLKNLPPLIFVGKIDLCIRMDNQNWIKDFKTTGWILDQVISKANRSPQLIGYSYAGKRVLDFEVNGCIASFHQINAYKSRKTGEYGDSKFEFRRVPQIYTAGDIAAWKLSFIDTAKDIQFAVENDLWPESFDNCYQYGQCAYLKLCQQHCEFENLNTDGYHIDFWDVLEEGE